MDSGREGYIMGGSHIVVKKRGIFWEGGVDSGRVAYINLLKKGVYSGGGVYILGGSHIFVEKGGILWVGGVDSGSVAHSC